MARLAARQVGGYYPCPSHLMPAIASLLARDADSHPSSSTPAPATAPPSRPWASLLPLAEHSCSPVSSRPRELVLSSVAVQPGACGRSTATPFAYASGPVVPAPSS